MPVKKFFVEKKRAFKSRAQASVEFGAIVALSLLAVIPIVAFSSISFKNNVELDQAHEAALKLASAADYVYAHGEGSQVIVRAALPPLEPNSAVSGKAIMFKVRNIAGGVSEAIAFSQANLSNSSALPQAAGVYVFSVVFNDTTGNVTLSANFG